MRFQHILQKVYHEPWLITPGAHASIVALVESRILNNGEFKAEREGTDYCGDEVEMDQMEVRQGIAHIPIGGVVGIKFSSFEKGAGCVDLRDVMDEIDQAENNPQVRGVIFDIDSPGGMVSGLEELTDRISEMGKPKMAFTDGQICSAAYWIASACDQIFSTPSGDIGSIGVYIPWIDSAERYKEAGYNVKVIKSGKYKGMGYPGTPLTKDQETLLQDRVNSIAEDFYNQVRSTRGDISSDVMQGQTFSAKDALAHGLIDQIVSDKDEVCALL